MVWFEPRTSEQAQDAQTDQLRNSIQWRCQQMSKTRKDQADTTPMIKPLTTQIADPEEPQLPTL